VAQEHLEAGESFLAEHRMSWSDLDLIGMHGQTVLHERPSNGAPGRTVQLGDAALLAGKAGRPVAFDFRGADMAAGGEGAPLAAIYHLARLKASRVPLPAAVLNVGGVANITLVRRDGGFTAFDTGPGNGMIDLLVQERGHGRFDEDGRLAHAGVIDSAAMRALLEHSYLKTAPPKSLDRYDFSLDPVRALSLQDAAATLTAFMVTAVVLAPAWIAKDERPRAIIVTGGGRRNPEIMSGLRQTLDGVATVLTAEEAGWRGDAIEAEAFAYLAARTQRRLPISFPATTGVTAPMTGGRIVTPDLSSAPNLH
jgi:anhydro-N-acetylmuramic acid kinase